MQDRSETRSLLRRCWRFIVGHAPLILNVWSRPEQMKTLGKLLRLWLTEKLRQLREWMRGRARTCKKELDDPFPSVV